MESNIQVKFKVDFHTLEVNRFNFNVNGKEASSFFLCLCHFQLNVQERFLAHQILLVLSMRGSLAVSVLHWPEASAAQRGVLKQSHRSRLLCLSPHSHSVRLESMSLQPFPRWQHVFCIINISYSLLRIKEDSSPPFLDVHRVAIWERSCSICLFHMLVPYDKMIYFYAIEIGLVVRCQAVNF